MKKIVVFDDGETWSDLDSVYVMELTDVEYNDLIENGTYPKYYKKEMTSLSDENK